MHLARADALTTRRIELALGAVRPTIFFGVPRVWEKFEEAIRAIGAQSTGLKKKLSTWAKGVALRRYRALSDYSDGRASARARARSRRSLASSSCSARCTPRSGSTARTSRSRARRRRAVDARLLRVARA